MAQRADKHRRIGEHQFKVYTKLVELQTAYLAAVINEQMGANTWRIGDDSVKEIKRLAREIADTLISEDRVPLAAEILEIIMSTKHTSAVDRHKEMTTLLTKLAKHVSPRYASAMKSIAEQNATGRGEGSSYRYVPIAMMDYRGTKKGTP